MCARACLYLCRGGIACGLSCRGRQLRPVATVTAVDRVHRDHCRLTRVESRARTPTHCTGNARPRMRDVTSPRRRNMADVIGKSLLSCSAKYTWGEVTSHSDVRKIATTADLWSCPAIQLLVFECL